MFDISWSELLIIGIVALIVIGPKELPGALRTLGQWMAKIRRMASEFQGQFQEAMREAELDQLKKEMDDMTAKAQSYAHFDPVDNVRRDIENSIGDLPRMDEPVTAAKETTAAQETATAPPAPEAANPTLPQVDPALLAPSDPPSPSQPAAEPVGTADSKPTVGADARPDSRPDASAAGRASA